MNPATGEASYTTPRGAPADYVQPTEIMKRFDPQTYERYHEALLNGGNWGSILVQFAKKIPQNKEWLTKYREESEKLINDLRSMQHENRFAGVDTASMDSFFKEMSEKVTQTPLADKRLLMTNLSNFVHILEY